MNHSASAPTVGGGGADAAAEEATPNPKRKYNIKQYKGLLGSINDIKSSVEDERRRAKEREAALQARMKESETESAIVQKELSVQLRCAGRSYQQLLGATRELTEQLRVEEDRRVTEIEALERQVKDLKSQLGQAAKPWKEEVAKRDLKILKLQEAAVDQEARLRKAEAKLGPVQEQAAKEIKAREEQFEVVVNEIAVIKSDYEKQLTDKDELFEREVERAKKEKGELLIRMKDVEEKAEKVHAPYKRQIKELELKVQGLEHQLSQVDYSPYEKQLAQRELGYEKLVKDFRIKQQLNYENLERMRAGFELTLERMDKKIQENEHEHERRLKPWQDLVEKRENEIFVLKGKIEDIKAQEEATRKAEAELLAEVRKELAAAKKAEELSRQEALAMKKQAEELKEKDTSKADQRKVQLLQLKLEEVTKQCEATVRSKDRELKQKTDIITALQQRVLEEVENREDDDKEWNMRVQKKEEGYGVVCADLAYAEGQILEERKKTKAALETVRRRERSIERIKGEHDEECRVRLSSHEALEQRIRELEAEKDGVFKLLEHEKTVVRQQFAEQHDKVRRRYEEQVADLRVEMARRDRHKAEIQQELDALRLEFSAARTEWDDKQRELQVQIRGRDRQIVALKNEIEFINDSWEIKYSRLMGLFEKLQKKYEDTMGPNGPQEAYRRIRDLKIENQELVKEIMELKEMIKKQKRQIRDLQLDYDILVKETADIIAEKERGMAEMVGDMAKLEAKLRHEIELKERLVKEMTAEKLAIVASFEGRIRQLEQQVEAMRFTDRQELVDTIDVWKRAYERSCIERDELEDHYKELLDIKDKQVQKMAEEYAEVKAEVQKEIDKRLQMLEECEERWKKEQARWSIAKMELEKEIRRLREELAQAIRERDRERGVADARAVPDPELEVLRKKLKEKEEQLAAIEAGIKNFVEENTQLREDLEKAKIREETAQADWEPQIRWRDERYEAMVKEHEAIKEILQMEMRKAQETCKIIEEQVRYFPNPFEQELKEAEDKYAQSQAGLMKLSQSNVHLKQEILDLKEENEKNVAQFEEQLAMAAHILKEVASLGALKSLSKAEIDDLEQALGIDLDGDGQVGGR